MMPACAICPAELGEQIGRVGTLSVALYRSGTMQTKTVSRPSE